jgi:hypothetical protein
MQPWYVLFDTSNGHYIAGTTTNPGAPAPGQAVRYYEDKPDGVWDEEKRDYPDPAFAGDDTWYVYVDGSGKIQDVDKSNTAPTGLTSIKVQPFPTGVEDWDSDSHSFEIEPGIRALLLRVTIPNIRQRIETIEWLRDSAQMMGLPAEVLGAINTDLDARLDALNGYLALALSAYSKAG